MASQTAARFAPSATSTWLIKSGTGTVYGYTVGNPASGGSVVVADLLDAGATPNLGIPSTFGPGLISSVGPFPASSAPLDVSTYGRRLTNGLTVSLTSTTSVFVHYD